MVLLMNIPTAKEVLACNDKNKLLAWREYLMDNVAELIKNNKIEWTIWEKMICVIDHKLYGIPINIYLPPDKDNPKGLRI